MIFSLRLMLKNHLRIKLKNKCIVLNVLLWTYVDIYVKISQYEFTKKLGRRLNKIIHDIFPQKVLFSLLRDNF